MKRAASLILVSALAVAGVSACQKDDAGMREQLDQIDQRLTNIESMLKQGARAPAARQPTRRRPGQPDPNKVYAVAYDKTDAWKGAKEAKITMIEAFEFA